MIIRTNYYVKLSSGLFPLMVSTSTGAILVIGGEFCCSLSDFIVNGTPFTIEVKQNGV